MVFAQRALTAQKEQSCQFTALKELSWRNRAQAIQDVIFAIVPHAGLGTPVLSEAPNRCYVLRDTFVLNKLGLDQWSAVMILLAETSQMFRYVHQEPTKVFGDKKVLPAA